MAPVSQHVCDDDCVCPIHHTPLYYAPASNDHACQDSACQWGAGGLNPGRTALDAVIAKRMRRYERRAL
jgi:hypothetical protein